jgi:hypothetical protein
MGLGNELLDWNEAYGNRPTGGKVFFSTLRSTSMTETAMGSEMRPELEMM